MEHTASIKIAVRHYPEDLQVNVSDIDLGQLIGGLTEEPMHLARGTDENGRIRIEVERTHEWEYFLGIAVAGGAVFAKSVIETLGERVGNWIADWAKNRLKVEPIEVRGGDDKSLKIDPSNPAANRTAFANLIESAAKEGATVMILFPW